MKQKASHPNTLVSTIPTLLSTQVSPVLIVIYDVLAVEDGEQRDQEPPVPVICHPAPIVTLACQVSQSIKRNLFILIQKHLQTRKCQTHIISLATDTFQILIYKSFQELSGKKKS